ncbi:hypothetical protein FACS1894172_21720 [Spirochaetia bacterium]|nr:hypothetical protein FACS1894172_21720 [Spirochaetia bacterium]
MPGMEMTVSEALTASRTAFDNEQYSESHWFATFAGKIARVESPEADQAQEYANKAWEKIALVEPARMEREIAERYQRKQEGYGAAINGNWVDAYYIFQELSKTIPNDRDVVEYLAKSEETLAQKAFFIDEVDQRFGIPLLDLEFSLPLQSEGDVKEPRHAVLYISSLLTFSDFSLGTTVKIVVYNQRGNALYRISTPYMKILPSSQDSRSKTVLLLQAVNRSYKDERLDPFWEGAERPAPLPASLTLDMSYQDFLLLSQLQRHVEQLFLGELVASAWRFDSKEVQAELLYRIIDTAIFMILAVLAVGIGFRFRSRTSSVPYWLFPIITAVLVLLLYEGVTLYRMLLHSLGILSIVSLGFPVTIILFSVGVIVLLTLSLNSAVA